MERILAERLGFALEAAAVHTFAFCISPHVGLGRGACSLDSRFTRLDSPQGSTLNVGECLDGRSRGICSVMRATVTAPVWLRSPARSLLKVTVHRKVRLTRYTHLETLIGARWS